MAGRRAEDGEIASLPVERREAGQAPVDEQDRVTAEAEPSPEDAPAPHCSAVAMADARRIVHEARLLLNYGAHHALGVPQKAIRTVLELDAKLHAGDFTAADEFALRNAFRDICKAMYPVTVQSICDTHGLDPRHDVNDTPLGERAPGMSWRGIRRALTPAVATRYSVLALATLLAVLLTQVFWLVGASLTSDIDQHLEHYDALAISLLEREAAVTAGDVAADIEVEKLYLEMQTLFGQLVADGRSLHAWNLAWENFSPIGEPPFKTELYARLDPAGQARVDSASARLVLQAIVSYLLPLLVGLLGACVYVIRVISDEIASSTFTAESTIRYGLRLALGPLAGIAVGLLVVPELFAGGEPAAQPQLAVLQSLSPLALAFVAGYGIELVFALMDRVITAFVSARSRGPTVAPAPHGERERGEQ